MLTSGRQLVLLRIGQQLFIGLLCLVPGVLEAIGPPQADVEALDLGGRKLAPERRLRLEQGARLFVVPDGLLDGKDRQRLVAGLHTVAIRPLGLSGRERMIGQFGGPCAFSLEQSQGSLVQDEPARRPSSV